MRRADRRRLDALEESDWQKMYIDQRHDVSIDALIAVVDGLIEVVNYLRSRDTVLLPRVERIDNIVLVPSYDVPVKKPLVHPVPNSTVKGYHGT